MNVKNGWVFGLKHDLVVFTGPIILGLLIQLFHKSAVPGFRDHNIHFVYLQIFFNLVHVYSTYWYTYTSPNEWAKFRKYFIGFPIFYFVVQYALGYFTDYTLAYSMFSHFSMWHFIKQQQAWFHISAAKGVARDKWTSRIDSIAINAVTIGFSLASQAMDHSRGWFMHGDVVELPHILRLPLLILSWSAVAAYFIWHGRQYYLGKPINWAAHHIFLCALIIWGYNRLGPRTTLTFYFNQLHHAIPYMLLGYRYLQEKRQEGQKYWFPSVGFRWWIVGIFLFTATQGFFEMNIRGGEGFLPNFHDWMDDTNPIFATAFINMFSLTHFTLDMVLWNRKHNPGWTKALA